MKTITKTLLFFFFCLIINTSYARHILGGTFEYKVISVNNDIATVEIKLHVYRDANGGGANFDNNLQLAVYNYFNSEYRTFSITQINPISVSAIEFEEIEDCNTSSINYELGTYITEIELSTKNFDFYKIAYQRCCRENNISNIIDPDVEGIAITMDIYPAAFEAIGQEVNTKVEFPAVNDIGSAFTYDFSVEDEFTKAYYLTTPKAAGGIAGVNFGDPTGCDGITPFPADCPPEFDEVTWVIPSHPYGLNANLDLDKETGILSVDIPEVSKTLVGLDIERFLNGERTSIIRQQFLINTVDCSLLSSTNEREDEFTISPNPTTGFISFSSPLTEVVVMNITGKVQPLNRLLRLYESLDLSHLQHGLYYLKGKTVEGKPVLKKVMITN